MKKNIKKILSVLAAISVIGTASFSVSATSKEDVVAAARGAGFLEVYVQQLQSFLNTSNFTSDQYDVMIGALTSAGSEMDDVAMDYFGKTIAEMKGAAEEKAEEEGTPVDDSWLNEIADKLTDENMTEILDEIVDAGKELDLDVTVEQKGEKEYTVTVKDKEGNVQFVAPIGKLVDRTGVEAVKSENTVIPTITFAGVTTVGIAGAVVLTKALKKNEE